MQELNPNKMFDTVGERLAAAKSALRATIFGRGGAISIIMDGDKVKFKVNVLDKVFESIQDAVRQAAALGVTESVSFKNGKVSVTPGSKIASQAAIYEDVYKNLQNLTDDQKKILQRAGIDTGQLKSLKVDFATMRAKESGGAKAVAEQIAKFRKTGEFNGITIIDDEGARVIQFRSGQGLLNAYQANLLMTMSGHGTIDADFFGKVLREGSSQDLIGKLGKLGKRLRGFLSERDMPLVGSTLTDFLKPSETSDLSKAVLTLDPQYDLLRLFAADDDTAKVKGLTNAKKAFYEGKQTREYFGRILDSALNDPALGDDSIASLKAAINGFSKKMHDAKSSPWVSDTLKKYLENGFAKGSQERKALVDNIFASIEFAFDGSDLLNERNVKFYKNTLRKEKRNLNAIINDTARSASDREAAMLKRIELDSLLDNLGDTSSLQQITGRGFVKGLGNIKTAFEVTLFDKDELKNFAAIISKFGFKGEAGISKDMPQLILSGLGQGSGEVYVDPIASAFHPNLFADPDSLENMKRHGLNILSEFEEAVNSAVLPDRILNQLKIASTQNIEEIPSAMRRSAARNREFARALLSYHRSGVSVKNSPQMMNMLHSFFSTQAFREKDGFIQMIMPDTYRFAIDSEASLGANSRKLGQLGEGFEKMRGVNIAGEVINIDQDILKFRVQGHKMLLSAQAIGEFRHALGGFDLDDKGLPKLKTYVDNEGMNRLGFYIFRQPSGPEEVAFARAKLDAETIQALFDRTYFRKALDQMIEADDLRGLGLFELRDIITGNLKGGFDEDQMEQAIVRVYEQMGRNKTFNIGRLTREEALRIQQYGSSALRVTPDMLRNGVGLGDYSPQYTNSKVYKILTESDAFDMQGDISEILDQINVDPKLKKALNKASSFEEMMRILGAGFEQDKEAQALFATAFNEMATKRSLQVQGNLGTYINRSAVTGSVLNQYEEMLGSIGDQRVIDFLEKNYNIGLVAQEEAIDLSVNQSGSRLIDFDATRRMNQEIAQRSGRSISINDTGLARAVNELTGLGQAAGAKGGAVTLDLLGETAISNLGKLIGFSSGIDLTDDALRLGIDSFLLENRVNKGDIQRLAEGMLEGLEDVRGFASDQGAIDAKILELKEILRLRSDEDIKKYLLNSIGLDATSRFASLTKQQELGKLVETYFETTKKMQLSSMAKDQILASTKVSSESMSVAQRIIEDNKRALDSILDAKRIGLSEMSQLQRVNFDLLLTDTGRKVYSQIDAARNVANVNMLELFTAFDQMGTDVTSLGVMMGEDAPPNLAKIFDQGIAARRVREVLFYSRFDQTLANEALAALQSFSSEANPLNKEQIRIQAKAALEAMAEGQLDTMEAGIYQVLADSKSSILDEGLAQEAQRQVNIMDAIIDARNMEDTILALQARGTTSAADISEETDNSLRRLVAASQEDPTFSAGKTKYKRIGKKLEDFKDVFKQDKLIRRTTIAAAALVVGSLVYSEFRDRTSSDITGPPLLPGGNPYEKEYPVRVPNIADVQPISSASGMSYQVSINGSREDINKFNQMASELVNGNVNTTIYNRLPDMRRDPYSSMGQAY